MKSPIGPLIETVVETLIRVLLGFCVGLGVGAHATSLNGLAELGGVECSAALAGTKTTERVCAEVWRWVPSEKGGKP